MMRRGSYTLETDGLRGHDIRKRYDGQSSGLFLSRRHGHDLVEPRAQLPHRPNVHGFRDFAQHCTPPVILVQGLTIQQPVKTHELISRLLILTGKEDATFGDPAMTRVEEHIGCRWQAVAVCRPRPIIFSCGM